MIFPLPIISTPHIKNCAAKQRIGLRPAAGVKPPKAHPIFLHPVRNIGLDIAKASRVVLVVEENIRKEEPPTMPQKRLTTNGNVFRRTDGRWQSVIQSWQTRLGNGILRFIAREGFGELPQEKKWSGPLRGQAGCFDSATRRRSPAARRRRHRWRGSRQCG